MPRKTIFIDRDPDMPTTLIGWACTLLLIALAVFGPMLLSALFY